MADPADVTQRGGDPLTGAGTDRYPSGTDGYPAADDVPDAGAERREIWEELGFESQWEWLNHVEAEQSRMLGGPRLRFGPRGSIEVVDPDAERPVTGPLPSVTRREILETMPGGTKDGRQVGVKLSRDDYALLARAAAVCGVAPSTLARVLVARGARAIADDKG